MGLPSDEENDFLKKLELDRYSENWWRCMISPARAVETLDHYATLEVTIVLARNLPARESWTTPQQVDAAVEVWVNDIKMDDLRTHVVRAERCPVWNVKVQIPILAPGTMVRFQVIDDLVVKSQDVGFVEICVGDVPFNTRVSGSLELRLQENLKETSYRRYQSHKGLREDEVGTYKPELLLDISENRNSGETSRDDIKARRATAFRAMAKARTFFHACSHGCASQAGFPACHGAAAKAHVDTEHTERANAGELYLKMMLKKDVNSFKALFANALETPAPMHHGLYDMTGLDDDEDAHKEKKDKEDLANVNLQQVLDVIEEMRTMIMFDFIWCLYYYGKYILTWRKCWLSFALMFCMLLVCYKPVILSWAMIPSMLGIMLIANQCEAGRYEMTRGGRNAALSDDGFSRVAKWRSSKEMYRFVTRIVQDDMQTTITDEVKLRALSARIFRDGVKVMKIRELRAHLRRHASDCIAVDHVPDFGYRRGELVLVDERYLATVTSMIAPPDHPVEVKYDRERQADNKHEGRDIEEIQPWRIRRRNTINRVVKLALPGAIGRQIRNYYPMLLKTRATLFPLVDRLTNIVTWRHYGTALCITVVLFAISLFFTLAACIEDDWFYHEVKAKLPGGDHQVPVARKGARGITLFQMYYDNIIWGVLILVCFISNARWFAFFSSLAKILTRSCKRRKAPRCWAFHRQDAEIEARISGGQLPDPVPPMKLLESMDKLGHKIHDKALQGTDMLQHRFKDLANRLPPPPQLPRGFSTRLEQLADSPR